MTNIKYIVGIDEAGRGPLAGPVAVGVVLVDYSFDWQLLPGVNDSKQLKPEKREALFRQAWQLRRQKKLNWSVSMMGAGFIDEQGIVPAVNLAMRRSLRKVVKAPKEVEVRLDGSLKAPAEYLNQMTIIKGDQSEQVIGLASILAKVTRDRYMEKLAKISGYEVYDFASHKGYGTKKHCQLILEEGLSDEHRDTFCKKLLN